MSLDGQNAGAALTLLECVKDPDADISALTIRALLLLRRGHDALQRLRALLISVASARVAVQQRIVTVSTGAAHRLWTLGANISRYQAL